LQRPTAKDFTYIVSFLFRQVDGNFRITGKLEDEVLAFFKAMRYPFAISKASMQAVGTMHTWPTLLASITWMVELLTYDEEVQNDAANQAALAGSGSGCGSVDDFERADEKALFEYLGKAYKAFLDGDDDLYAQLEDSLVGSFETRCGEMQAQCQALETKIEDMRTEMAACHTRHAALPGLQQRHSDYLSDLGKFRSLIEQLTAHREGLAAKVEKREEELASLYRSLEDVRGEVGELKAVVAAQELSPEDVARMQQERARLDEALDKAREHKVKMHKTLWEAEIEVSRAVVDLETAAQTFNTKAAALNLIPITARNSNGIQYEMVVSKGAVSASAEPEELIGLDMKGLIRPSLAQIKNVMLDKVHEARTSVLKMLDEEAKTEEEVAEAVGELETLEGKVKKQEEGYKAEKARMEASMAEKVRLERKKKEGRGASGSFTQGAIPSTPFPHVLRQLTHLRLIVQSSNVDAVEEQVLHLRSKVLVDLETRTGRNHQRLAQLEAELGLEREEHEQASKAISESIMGALHALADHKEEVKRRLGMFAGDRKLGELLLPCPGTRLTHSTRPLNLTHTLGSPSFLFLSLFVFLTCTLRGVPRTVPAETGQTAEPTRAYAVNCRLTQKDVIGVWLYVCMCASVDFGGHSCVIEFSLCISACGMIKVEKAGMLSRQGFGETSA
jgi:hypothetical protein